MAARTMLRAVPANHQVIDDLTHAFNFTNSAADVEVVTGDADHALQANSVWQAANDETTNIHAIFST